jgi:hypothetical protein
MLQLRSIHQPLKHRRSHITSAAVQPWYVAFCTGCFGICLSVYLCVAELRRHKRSFLKLATKVTFSRLQDPAAAQRMFVDYIKQQLAAAG